MSFLYPIDPRDPGKKSKNIFPFVFKEILFDFFPFKKIRSGKSFTSLNLYLKMSDFDRSKYFWSFFLNIYPDLAKNSFLVGLGKK